MISWGEGRGAREVERDEGEAGEERRDGREEKGERRELSSRARGF